MGTHRSWWRRIQELHVRYRRSLRAARSAWPVILYYTFIYVYIYVCMYAYIYIYIYIYMHTLNGLRVCACDPCRGHAAPCVLSDSATEWESCPRLDKTKFFFHILRRSPRHAQSRLWLQDYVSVYLSACLFQPVAATCAHSVRFRHLIFAGIQVLPCRGPNCAEASLPMPPLCRPPASAPARSLCCIATRQMDLWFVCKCSKMTVCAWVVGGCCKVAACACPCA
jgi:hypothetical protein